MQFAKGFVLLAILGFAVATPITESENAPTGHYPHHATLVGAESGKVHCGGVIVDDHIIMTAASCLAEHEVGDFAVRYGSQRLSTGKSVNIEKFVMHPQFNGETRENNIALVYTSEKMQLKKGSAEVVHIVESRPVTGFNAFVSGHGATKVTDEAGAFSDVLRHTPTTILLNTECHRQYNAVHFDTKYIHDATTVCARSPSGRRLSHGDVGNPLYTGGRLAGIASAFADYKDNTARTLPDVYTDVSAYVSWMVDQF